MSMAKKTDWLKIIYGPVNECGFTDLSVPCSLVVTCWEKADLLALLYVMFSCVLVTFPYGVLGQVWYLTVSILCYFGTYHIY